MMKRNYGWGACPRKRCRGRLGCDTTRITRDEKYRVRYLVCRKCGARPNHKMTVPIETSPRRRPRR